LSIEEIQHQILHVGCGPRGSGELPALFHEEGWREIRLDINPDVQPDVVASMTNMPTVPDASVDAVYSSHNLEHLYAHEVPFALSEWARVLKPGGVVLVTVPDVQEVARAVADDRLEEVLYQSPAGPIFPIDVLWGLRSSIAAGNHFMAHKTGFTKTTMRARLEQGGFEGVQIVTRNYEIFATAIKPGGEPALRVHLASQAEPVGRWAYIRSLLSKL
jgi:SAM-dependent methyltransferase